MSLIATNKISEYIEQYPEARIPLLVWLKEYPYHLEKAAFLGQSLEPHQSCTIGQFGVGTGDYVIQNRINHEAKISCITWVGTKEEFQLEIDRKLKEILQRYPDTVQKELSITKIIQAPVPDMTEALAAPEIKDDPIDVNSEVNISEDEGFQTVSAYEQGLLSAALIFEAEPDTPEFDELLALAPLIKHFENNKLKFPLLGNFEAVKRKMEILSMTPLNFAHMVETEEQFNLFLSGKLALSDEIVNRLFKFLFIRFPINDPRFTT
ncbi:hypothetical protein [Pedobacter gandavensis]|uniref:hypothetical protein n=1 Tax=Pedobacter gandavensis TaxID=2679963 RepID=UPI00292D024D|nr:hypothetical protein [Pedobacter gandavensis]